MKTGAPDFLVVTGTDTGVGKTVVACGLAKRLADSGRRVLAVKPVESGCGAEVGPEEDGALLARATGQERPRSALVRLRAPLAPPVAADREGVALGPKAWVREILEFSRGVEFVLVEAAGGLLSPLAWGFDARDLAARLGAPALVVSADRLGTLNHTLLTLEALAARSVPVLGVVFSAPATPDDSTGTNAIVLRRVVPRVRVEEVPRLANLDHASRHLGAAASWLEER